MKKLLILPVLIVVLSVRTSFAQPTFPEPVGFVNDFADILSEETEAKIQSLVEQIQQETSAEVAVVTVDSLEGYDQNTYAVELGRAWGVGSSERDDGVVFLTSVGDRITYIATGYGVEGYITDAQAFWITDQVVVPYFKQGDFDGGILAGVEQIKLALVDLEPLPDGYSSDSSTGDLVFNLFFWFFFLLSFVFPWVTAVFARSKRWWPGGVVGAILGGFIAVFFSVSFFIVLPLALFGLLMDYLASSNYKKGKDSWWTGGGSSGWGGGSSGGWGGGSSSGGGFGGFSGGSFGGGGGGSSW